MTKIEYFNPVKASTDVGSFPVFFQGVTMQVFPLRADMGRLSLFCDSVLNTIAPDKALFRVAAPFVIMQALHYSKMTPQELSFGWTAQNELLFSIPLEWYRVESGRPVFHDMATFAPFIFVDNDRSVMNGREIFGWQKVKGRMTPKLGKWVLDPRQPTELFRVSTYIFPKLYAGREAQERVFLELEQKPLPSLLSLPPTLGQAAAGSIEDLQWFYQAMVSAFTGYLQNSSDPVASVKQRFENVPWPFDVAALWKVLTSFYRTGASFNTVNVKQQRDPMNGLDASFQGLTNAPIKITNLHAGGYLGEAHLALGDASGGHEIKVFDYEEQPIVERLGLSVASSGEEDGVRYSVVKPVLPLWAEVDMEYKAGDLLSMFLPVPEDVTRPPKYTPPKPKHYNTLGGGALVAQPGPFLFQDSEILVLPLRVDPAQLREKFLHSFHEMFDSFSFDLFSFNLEESNLPKEIAKLLEQVLNKDTYYVFLVVANHGKASSLSTGIGSWVGEELSFLVPVKVEEKVGFLVAFSFMNNQVFAITGQEMMGWPTAFCYFQGVDEAVARFVSDDAALAMDVEMLPVLYGGQRIERRRLLEIHAETATDRVMVSRLSDPSKDPSARIISVRQARAPKNPDRACFQALMASRADARSLRKLQLIHHPTKISIFRNPMYPIAETLGLVTDVPIVSRNGTNVDVFESAKSFKVDAEYELKALGDVLWRSDLTGVEWLDGLKGDRW